MSYKGGTNTPKPFSSSLPKSWPTSRRKDAQEEIQTSITRRLDGLQAAPKAPLTNAQTLSEVMEDKINKESGSQCNTSSIVCSSVATPRLSMQRKRSTDSQTNGVHTTPQKGPQAPPSTALSPSEVTKTKVHTPSMSLYHEPPLPPPRSGSQLTTSSIVFSSDDTHPPAATIQTSINSSSSGRQNAPQEAPRQMSLTSAEIKLKVHTPSMSLYSEPPLAPPRSSSQLTSGSIVFSSKNPSTQQLAKPHVVPSALNYNPGTQTMPREGDLYFDNSKLQQTSAQFIDHGNSYTTATQRETNKTLAVDTITMPHEGDLYYHKRDLERTSDAIGAHTKSSVEAQLLERLPGYMRATESSVSSQSQKQRPASARPHVKPSTLNYSPGTETMPHEGDHYYHKRDLGRTSDTIGSHTKSGGAAHTIERAHNKTLMVGTTVFDGVKALSLQAEPETNQSPAAIMAAKIVAQVVASEMAKPRLGNANRNFAHGSQVMPTAGDPYYSDTWKLERSSAELVNHGAAYASATKREKNKNFAVDSVTMQQAGDHYFSERRLGQSSSEIGSHTNGGEGGGQPMLASIQGDIKRDLSRSSPAFEASLHPLSQWGGGGTQTPPHVQRPSKKTPASGGSGRPTPLRVVEGKWSTSASQYGHRPSTAPAARVVKHNPSISSSFIFG